MRRTVWLSLALAVCCTGAWHGRATAAPPHGGFTTIISPALTGEEIGAQENLWALEVSIKPMRMIFAQLTDPKTGAKSSEIVWYLVYKISNRPVPKKVETGDAKPENPAEPPAKPIFAPRATLVTNDRDGRKVIVDTVIPEAIQAIDAREGIDLKSSVEIAGMLNQSDSAADEKSDFGVFVFRGVDPRTTSFTVYLSGFSSAYKTSTDAAGKKIYLRRTVKIPYRRLADEFDQFEKEIRQSSDPTWVYVPDEPAAMAKP